MYIIVSYELQQLQCHYHTKSVLPTKLHYGYLSSDSSPSCLHAFVPYYSYLLLLLNFVVLKALWTIDVFIISNVVNKILYYYYYKRKQLSDTTEGLLIL